MGVIARSILKAQNHNDLTAIMFVNPNIERVRILSDGTGDNAPCYGLDSCAGVQIR